jgi:hypothetical protein
MTGEGHSSRTRAPRMPDVALYLQLNTSTPDRGNVTVTWSRDRTPQ